MDAGEEVLGEDVTKGGGGLAQSAEVGCAEEREEDVLDMFAPQEGHKELVG
jgi:hypothetical protein